MDTEWKDNKDNFILWVGTYRFYEEHARKGDLLSLFLLKEHCQEGHKYFIEISASNKGQLDSVLEVFDRLQADYNPDLHLAKFEDNLICIDIFPESHLYEMLGERICGKFIGMSSEKMTTRLRNPVTGVYEEENVDIIINLGYPTSNDILKLSVLDIDELETFK